MKITIMRGIPGSGKSTYAKNLSSDPLADNLVICSADDFFIQPETGEYVFDVAKLQDAHQECMHKFLNMVWGRCRHIVVDNTNINPVDVAPYIAVGEAMGYDVEIVQFKIDADVAAARNQHRVPRHIVREMDGRLAVVHLPKRWKVRNIQNG